MKTTHLLLAGLASSALLAASALAGCGGSGANSGGAGGGSSVSSSSSTMQSSSSQMMSSSSGMPVPTPPKLGAQIDRFGRPAINTALNHTFDPNAMTKGTAKDGYNADSDQAKWASAYTAEFATNLAIFDGLDTICGNQLGAGPMPVKGRYDKIAGALADDRLWVKTDAAMGMCTTYLAVELDALMAFPNKDCGGRKLDYDPIDASYAALSGAKMLGDGVGPDADTKGTTFPYLAAPH